MRLLILHINSSFGGAERTTGNLLKYLDREPIEEVVFFASGAIRDYFPVGSYDRFIDTQAYGLSGWFVNLRTLLRDAKAVSGILQREAPDVVLSVMHYPSALLVFSSLFSKARMRKVISFRGPVYEHMRHFEHGILRKIFLWSVISTTMIFADRVIVPSKGVKEELKRYFLGRDEKIEVIPNGIDIDLINVLKNKPIDDCDVLVDKRYPVICSASRLSPEKNLCLLLEAFSIIRKKIESTLVIIGDGPEFGRLKGMAEDLGISGSVYFLGEKGNVFPYIFRSDIYVHTCLFEGFGYNIIEAMACGTPVVATDCPYGPAEIIEGRYGVLVSPDEPVRLAEVVISLLKDRTRLEELASLGIRRAKELSITRMIKEYERVILTS
jgi:glycosyltransferase involved in cell wall biosynthesis